MKLSSAEKTWAEAALEAIIPPGGDVTPLSANDTKSIAVLEDMVMWLSGMNAVGLRAAVWFFEFGGATFGGVGLCKRFSRLPLPDREAAMVKLNHSRFFFFRQMALLMKTMACFGFGADSRVRTALGMDRPVKFVKRGVQS
jgi:hypothetical protein